MRKRLFTSLAALPLVALVAAPLAPANAAVDFAKEIKPLFEARCMECHGPVKPKGKFNMATKETFMKGSDGKVVVAGMPEKSRIIELISLPADDPDIMPAKGDPLTKEQVELVKNWIKEGGAWPEGVELVSPKKADAPKPDPLNTPGLPVSDAEKKAVDAAQQKGALAMRLAQNTNWLRVDFSLHGADIKDADVAIVKDMPNLVDLDLGGTQITDAALANVAGLQNLYRLHLERTKVTGAGLAQLAKLPKLEYINLYATEIDDAAVQQLAAVKSLKKVYLWQTKVTKDGAAKLTAAVPGLYVNIGWEAEAAAQPKPQPADAAGGPADPNAPKYAIKEIMEKAMKSDLCKKVCSKQGNPDEVKLLLDYLTELPKHKAPQGDEAKWKEMTNALLAAATQVSKGEEAGFPALGGAMNCKNCHTLFKPKQ